MKRREKIERLIKKFDYLIHEAVRMAVFDSHPVYFDIEEYLREDFLDISYHLNTGKHGIEIIPERDVSFIDKYVFVNGVLIHERIPKAAKKIMYKNFDVLLDAIDYIYKEE